MKRTLAISLLLASGVAAAQNPAVVQKNVQTAVKANTPGQTAAVSVKPSPATVKVTPASTAKPTVVAAKPAVSVAKPVALQAKPAAVVQVAPTKTAVPNAKTSAATKPATVAVPVKGQAAAASVKPVAVVATPAKSGPKAAPVAAKAAPATVKVSGAKADPFKSAKAVGTSANESEAEEKKPAAAKSVRQAGRRDPFLSPVVNMSAVGSGCSSGKRCLAIDQISLRGIVKSDNGMIAVVVNATDKAYFLRENDPVFNGYVIKITGDSVVFKETFHDKLGKPLTRDITKTISRPVA